MILDGVGGDDGRISFFLETQRSHGISSAARSIKNRGAAPFRLHGGSILTAVDGHTRIRPLDKRPMPHRRRYRIGSDRQGSLCWLRISLRRRLARTKDLGQMSSFRTNWITQALLSLLSTERRSRSPGAAPPPVCVRRGPWRVGGLRFVVEPPQGVRQRCPDRRPAATAASKLRRARRGWAVALEAIAGRAGMPWLRASTSPNPSKEGGKHESRPHDVHNRCYVRPRRFRWSPAPFRIDRVFPKGVTTPQREPFLRMGAV